MLSNFENESVFNSGNLQRVENGRKSIVKVNIDNGSNNLGDFTALSDGH